MPAAAVVSAVMAISVSTVTNSIGVNTHLDFKKFGYQNLGTTAAAINYLGVKNLRDCPGNASDVGPNGSWQQIANATGAKFDAYMTEGSPASDTANLAFATQLAKQGLLNFIEGGNENDDPYALSQGNSIAWTANFQQQVFATGHALGLPVINMSFGSGWTTANNWRGNYDKVGDLSAFADYANAHTYPSAKQQTDGSIQRLNASAKLAAGSRPVITTEIGWHTGKIGAADAARFALYAVFDGIKNGNPKTYFYALYDDNSGKFGLMNPDGTAKPAGTALHNLTSIMADSGSPRAETLAFALSRSGNDNSLLMEKSNGAFQLALWNENDAAHSVTLTLGAVAQTIRIYDPLTGTSAVQTATNTSSVTVKLPDHPIIVEIVPGGLAAAPAEVTPAAAMPALATKPNVVAGLSAAPRPAPDASIWTAPETLTVVANRTLTLSGIGIADSWAAGHAGKLALNLTARTGTIAGTDSAGKPLPGSGSSAVHMSGTLAALNSALPGVTYNAATAGADQLTLDLWDQAGGETKKIVAIKVVP